ncbi:MAG: nodulation protein NfeD [Dehalococcoidia bacterium]|nr:nodulation protein NfeD [Dehalococcoidia bacterium]
MKRQVVRIANILMIMTGLVLVLATPSPAVAAGPTVDVLHVDGIIVPVVGDYIARGIRVAESDGAQALVIELNTPGGDYATTVTIVQSILNSAVPVIVYVSPAGGWAGSAGTFITLAAHIAAMAPGSRIGAAHPVTPGSNLTPTEEQKITEDAAAFIRSIAKLKGRDPDLAESAVRQSRSFSVDEAIKGKLVDLQASDLNDLLAQVNGRMLTLSNGKTAILTAAGPSQNPVPMSGIEAFLQTISNPNIAYVLLAVGGLGVIAELFNPGMALPGILGGACLLLGFYALGVLNAYWGGVLLIVLAFGLLIADVFVSSHGILTAGGIATLVLGSLVLFSGGPAAIQVNRGLIAGVSIAIGAFFLFIVAAVIKGQRRKAVTGREGLIGQVAIATTALNPEGMVAVLGEHWSAVAHCENIEPGEEVVVTHLEGLKLTVEKKAKSKEDKCQ